jgi:steroid delta-isomerase-like uncharacterized protein
MAVLGVAVTASGQSARPSAAHTVVTTKQTSLGTILETSSGQTLYLDVNDRAGHFACTGMCRVSRVATARYSPGGDAPGRAAMLSRHGRRACSQACPPLDLGGVSMDHAASAQRFYDLINAGDIDAFIGLLAADFVEHEQMPGSAPGREGTRQLFTMIQAAFPDMHWAAEDILAADDKVAARVRFTGTNDGEFMGMPATGKSASVQVIDIIRFGDDGLAHEHWGVFDMMGLMQQLGLAPGAPA